MTRQDNYSFEEELRATGYPHPGVTVCGPLLRVGDYSVSGVNLKGHKVQAKWMLQLT